MQETDQAEEIIHDTSSATNAPTHLGVSVLAGKVQGRRAILNGVAELKSVPCLGQKQLHYRWVVVVASLLMADENVCVRAVTAR
jgi:hypothetical protein